MTGIWETVGRPPSYKGRPPLFPGTNQSTWSVRPFLRRLCPDYRGSTGRGSGVKSCTGKDFGEIDRPPPHPNLPTSAIAKRWKGDGATRRVVYPSIVQCPRRGETSGPPRRTFTPRPRTLSSTGYFLGRCRRRVPSVERHRGSSVLPDLDPCPPSRLKFNPLRL